MLIAIIVLSTILIFQTIIFFINKKNVSVRKDKNNENLLKKLELETISEVNHLKEIEKLKLELEENEKNLSLYKEKGLGPLKEYENEIQDQINRELERKELEAKKKYELLLQEEQLKWEEDKTALEDKRKSLTEEISDLESIAAAAIKSRIELHEKENFEEFHRIHIEDNEISQIQIILETINRIPGEKIKTAMNHLIFDYYYRNAIDDMIKRSCHGNRISGIYKITHIPSGKCYIGQSVDIANRWLTHCKRGSGIDNSVNNKLYPEMIKYGIYNFTFEIIEVVEDTDKLSKQEKYWSNYFGAKIFGYSIRN